MIRTGSGLRPAFQPQQHLRADQQRLPFVLTVADLAAAPHSLGQQRQRVLQPTALGIGAAERHEPDAQAGAVLVVPTDRQAALQTPLGRPVVTRLEVHFGEVVQGDPGPDRMGVPFQYRQTALQVLHGLG